jgi:hypothetical protein
MLAGTSSDVRIPALSWESDVATFMLKHDPTTSDRPAGTDHNRLVAALCAQSVPKFLVV